MDFIVTSGLATAGTQATDPLLNVIRRSVSVLWAAGYNPDTLILTPANSESLNTLTSGGTAGWPGPYVFGAGQFGPSTVYDMNVRVSKNIASPAVVDSQAFGKLYAGPSRSRRSRRTPAKRTRRSSASRGTRRSASKG